MTDTAKLLANGLEFSALRAGSPTGELVVFLHGFPDTPATFRHQISAIADDGFDVIAPWLRGYQPSSQPADGDYELMTLASDVIGWLDHLEIERAHLIGHDWGAAISHTVAAHHPDRLLTAAALAVPPLARIPKALRKVPRQLQRSWYMTWFQAIGLADRSVQADDWRLMRRLWTSWSPDYPLSDDEWEQLRAAYGQPGVLQAMLAYYRQNATPPILLGLRKTSAMTFRPVKVPMLVLHGTNDGCMDRRLFIECVVDADYPAGVKRIEVANAGHFLQLEQPEAVTAHLRTHLNTPA